MTTRLALTSVCDEIDIILQRIICSETGFNLNFVQHNSMAFKFY